MGKLTLEITEFRGGAVVLSCAEEGEGEEKGMEADLVFSLGGMTGDPLLVKQRDILERIAAAVNAKGKESKGPLYEKPSKENGWQHKMIEI
tara:strand:- start:15 stop:287 length:273 start_codon:yes stop_codon:yes gene_type:complete